MKKICCGGFTLPEMMMVMLITGLLATGGLQGWQRWQQQWHLQDSASQLRQFLLGLRSVAGWQNSDWLIQLCPQRSSEANWCLQATESGGQDNKLFFRAPRPGVHLLTATEGVGFYGRRDVARPGSFTLQNAAGALRVVVASRGRVRICAIGDSSCDG